MSAQRIAALNNKGGVGKTKLAAVLVEAAARAGRRVLAVDMDPQANLTRRLRTSRQAGRTLAEVLTPGVRNGAAGDVIARCGWDLDGAEQHITVLPASLALEDRVLEAGTPGAVKRLRKALYGVDEDHDYTIIDCAPSVGHLTQLVLAALDTDDDTAPDTVIIPVAPEWDAIAGARRVIEFVSTYKDDLDVPHLRPAGLVVNLVRKQTSLHDGRVEALPGLFADVPILSPSIGQRARIAELQDAGEPLLADRELVRSGAAADLTALAARVLRLPVAVPA